MCLPCQAALPPLDSKGKCVQHHHPYHHNQDHDCVRQGGVRCLRHEGDQERSEQRDYSEDRQRDLRREYRGN